MGVLITGVSEGGVAQEIGLSPGDVLVAVNGQPLKDYLDYLYVASEGVYSVHVRRACGEEVVFEFEEPVSLGVELEQIRPKRCKCRCIFCFMDQMPKGLRRTLYLKDDDYRLSFLYGNYITLVGMSEGDWERIGRMRLSPLYVSVHATHPEVRAFMMGHPEAALIMDGLRRLIDMGVVVHAQIVVCPGVNDGAVLEGSIEELAALYPGVRSVAVVPVGVTKYRDGLFPIRPVGKEEAEDILRLVLARGEECIKSLGSRFVFPADELFIKAGRPFPSLGFYEELWQLEDGVGMVPMFLESVRHIGRRLRGVLFATGVDFAPFLEWALHKASVEHEGVVAVSNVFFGNTVTVTGLLTGVDIVESCKDKEGDVLVLPEVLFNDDGLTIDDMSAGEIGERLGKKVVVAPADPEGFWQFISDL